MTNQNIESTDLKVQDFSQKFNMIPIDDGDTVMTDRADNKNKFKNQTVMRKIY